SATVADAARDQIVELEPDRTPLAALEDGIGRLEHALRLRPDDGPLHNSLGRMYADRCRLQLYQQLLDDNSNADARQRRQLWNSVAVAALGNQSRQLVAAGNTADLDRLRTLGPIQQNVEPARRHFEQALRHSPL